MLFERKHAHLKGSMKVTLYRLNTKKEIKKKGKRNVFELERVCAKIEKLQRAGAAAAAVESGAVMESRGCTRCCWGSRGCRLMGCLVPAVDCCSRSTHDELLPNSPAVAVADPLEAMGSTRSCPGQCWRGCSHLITSCFAAPGHCSTYLRPSPQHELPAAAAPPVANALQHQLPEITLEQLEKIIPLIEDEFHRLDPASTSSSSSQAPISQHLGNMLAQWEDQKQICTSFINSLPKNLTKEVAGDGRRLLMPLLTDALHGMGGVHWLGVGFTFIAWSLDSINNIIQNREDCIGILRQSLRLLRNTKEIWQATNIDNAEKDENLQDSVEKAFRCAIFCTSNLTETWILRFWKAPSVKDAIAMLAAELDRANIQNIEFMGRHKLKTDAAKVEHQISFHLPQDDIGGTGGDVIDDAVTFLQTSSDDIKAVFLHGMGGIGKSFLGLKIFTAFQKHQATHTACRVELQLETNEGDLCAVQKQILEKVCKRAAPAFSNLVDGRQHLEKELKQINHPFFLYVDNVLEPKFLTDLLPKADSFPRGSRMLITSRGEYIKHGILGLGITDPKPIEVKKLQQQQAQLLLWEQLGSKGEHRDIDEVESLEKRVLMLCEGLPLALVVVGKYIANEQGLKDAEVWREVVQSMEKAEPFYGTANDELYARIRFSIDKLDERVKAAFLDMIFYLDRHRIWRQLDKEWEAVERLISHRYLRVLCQRALVRKDEIQSNAEIHDVLKALGRRMVVDDKHELRIAGMDELQQHNSALEKVVALYNVTVNADQLKQMPRLRLLSSVDVRVAEGDCQEIQVTRDLRVVRYLRCSAARVFDWSKIASLKELSWGAIFGEAGAATNVSNLEEVFKREQISMGLEALSLTYWKQLKAVDVIETLTCLKELRLHFCHAIESLPEGISRLTGLKHLSLQYCKKLKGLPQGISSLKCLELLDLGFCSSVQSLPDGLTSLTRLTELDLSFCRSLQSIPEGIGNLTRVTQLDLQGCESLEAIPDGATTLMRGLTELSLSGCSRIEYLPQGISRLTGLKILRLEGCVSLLALPEGVSGLTDLKLDLRGCVSLLTLPEGVSGLKMLDLEGCVSLLTLPPGVSGLTDLTLRRCTSLRNFPEGIASLIKLDLRWCKALQSQQLPRLTGLTVLHLAASSSLPQAIPEKLGFMTQLTQLHLSFLQMQSLPDEISELTSLLLLDLSSCKSLQSIQAVTTLTALVALQVEDCTELQLLPEGFTSLTSLRWIGLSGCRSLQSIPEEFGRLPGLHRLPVQDDLKYATDSYNVKRLDLSNCESLKSLPQIIGSSFTLLAELDLQNCTSLKSLPEAVTRLSNLTHLSLLGCRSLECLPSGLTSSLTSLRKLKIGECAMLIQPLLEEVSWSSMRSLEGLTLSKCEDLRSLPKGITTLMSLTELSLRGCRNFQWLPQGMANWRGLRRLDLSGCQRLQSLPEELTTMTAITELDLSGCACLRALPQGIFTSLAGLERLDISGCGGLQLEKSQGMTRLRRLALSESEHLLLLLSGQGLALDGLTRLQIVGCKSLQCLPEGVAALEELRDLSVSGCESLQSLSNLPQGSTHCLQILDLTGCGGTLDQASVWEMIVSFKSLWSLNLSGWESIPEQIASLENLWTLGLSKCSSLLSLPESVTKLRNLHGLILADCKSLRSLPPGMTCLVNLERLDLSGCTSLEPLPEALRVWISCIPHYEPCLHNIES